MGMDRVMGVSRAMVVLLTLAMLGLLVRVAQLQVTPSRQIAEQIGSQTSTLSLPAQRGDLRDARNRLLATSSSAQRLFVDPQLIEDPSTFAEHLGFAIGSDPAEIARKISRRAEGRYVVIQDQLTTDQVRAVQALGLPAIGVEPWSQRTYPHGEHAGQLIGAVGVEGKGLEGAERLFETTLAAAPGRLSYLRDVRRRALWIADRQFQPAQDGQPVQLSIDLTIQVIAERALAAACEQYDADSGQLVVMDPRTGEVLAMANWPAFDPNQLSQSTPAARRNRCVTDVFEPGSIFKPIVWAAATELGIAKPDRMIDTTTSGYWVSPQRRALRDTHGHGKISWEQVLVVSSNIGMAQIGLEMGTRQLHNAVRAFGFGAPTGSGLAGESPGIVNPVLQWNHYSLTSVPMGQEIAVNALQIVRAYCAIANDGWLPTPTIRAVTGENDNGIYPIEQRVISSRVAQLTRQALRKVVTDPQGTGRKARSDQYTIFGKSGTAQIADRVHGGYLQGQYVGSFVGGAPVDKPRIIVGCFIHKPDKAKGYYGGTVAAPAVKQVIEEALPYLGVAPITDSPEPPHAVPPTRIVQR